jgi:hypothetical protein
MSETVAVFPDIEWEQSPVIGEIAKALALAQGEMKNAAKTSANPFFKSKYADLAEVRDACLPALNSHGIAVVQGPVTRRQRAGVRTMLAHTSGEWMACTALATPKDEGPQSYGSVVSYLRRYSLAAMAGVATEDDDGNAAEGDRGEKRTPKRAQHTTMPAADFAEVEAMDASVRAAVSQDPPRPKDNATPASASATSTSSPSPPTNGTVAKPAAEPAKSKKPVAGGALPANQVPAKHGERGIVEGQLTRIHQLRGQLPGWDGDHSHPEHLYTVALRGYKTADGNPIITAKDLTFEQASNLIKRMQGLAERKMQAFDRMEDSIGK